MFEYVICLKLYKSKDVYAIDYSTVVIKVVWDMINRIYMTVHLQF
jgi:hypothetical protein